MRYDKPYFLNVITFFKAIKHNRINSRLGPTNGNLESLGRLILFLIATAGDFCDHVLEFCDILEAAVNRCEADVGDFIEQF